MDTVLKFKKEIGYLRPQRYIQLLEANHFRNCPIISEDAKRSYDIYGYNTNYLQEETTRQTSPDPQLSAYTPSTNHQWPPSRRHIMRSIFCPGHPLPPCHLKKTHFLYSRWGQDLYKGCHDKNSTAHHRHVCITGLSGYTCHHRQLIRMCKYRINAEPP